MKDGRGHTEIEPNSALPSNHTASQITGSAANSRGHAGLAMRTRVRVCVCVYKCVFAYYSCEMRERDGGREGEREKEKMI